MHPRGLRAFVAKPEVPSTVAVPMQWLPTKAVIEIADEMVDVSNYESADECVGVDPLEKLPRVTSANVIMRVDEHPAHFFAVVWAR